MKASSWPMATSCSSPKRNILALMIPCAKAMKRHNNNNSNNYDDDNNNAGQEIWRN